MVTSKLPLPKDKSIPTLEYSGHRLAPASYHDQWLVEGLTRYLAAVSSDGERILPECNCRNS